MLGFLPQAGEELLCGSTAQRKSWEVMALSNRLGTTNCQVWPPYSRVDSGSLCT